MKSLLQRAVLIFWIATPGVSDAMVKVNCDADTRLAKVKKYREVRVASDASGIFVYQAFSPAIAEAAVKNQTFNGVPGFKFERMTWIKLSLPWMLYRSNFARSPGQERILKIKISHSFFHEILAHSISSSSSAETIEAKTQWKKELGASDIVFQWDPDRDYAMDKVPRRHVLQLGLRGRAVDAYVNGGIIGIEDITPFAKELSVQPLENRKRSDLPIERDYSLPADVRAKLFMD